MSVQVEVEITFGLVFGVAVVCWHFVSTTAPKYRHENTNNLLLEEKHAQE